MSDRFKFEGEVTYGQMFNDLLSTIQAEDVAEYLEACIQYTMGVGNMDHDAAEDVVRQNIGYIAGYFSTETAARIHNLFKVSHPIFGTADTWESLTPEDMLKKGMELASEATAPTAAAQGEVCRCGYPMADHDADGECPGDGYLGDDDAEPLELSVHRFIPGLWRVTHVDGVASMELVAEEATDPNEVIRKHLDANKFLDAIKAHRKMYGSGLREAKEAVEAMQYNRPTYAELEAALQQAQRERDAAVAREKMLLASLHNIRDMRVNPTGDSKYDEGRQMGYQITTELAQAAINAHAKAASAQQAAQPADGEG